MGFRRGLVSLLVVIVAAGGVGGALVFQLAAPPPAFTQDLTFTVENGESLSSIATRLEAQGVIRSALLLRFLALVRGTEREFKRGEYLLKGGSSLVEIHDQIVSGRQLLFRVTLNEGWTATRMSRALEAQRIVSAEDFLRAVREPELIGRLAPGRTTLEGLLYPDTYLFARNTPAEFVVRTLVERFYHVVESLGVGASRENLAQWYGTVILASIVEREYRVVEEAPLISSVFHNRLRYRIPLGSCATIEYILTEIQGKPHPRRILFSDTEIPSPYNTYLNPGLPPAPIGNPGKVALTAAFRPAATDYLFFVVKDPRAGTHTFSRTIADHMAAREIYLNTYVPKL